MARRVKKKPDESKAKAVVEEIAKDFDSQFVDRVQAPGPVLPAIPEMSEKAARVVVAVFDINIDETYAELEGELELNDALTPQSVRRALNKVEENARKAHRLFIATKTEQELYEVQAEKVLGAMRTQAVERLSLEKEAKIFTKQINEADIKLRMADMFPDEWDEIAARRLRFEGTVEHLKRLSELWQSRCRSLSSLNHNG